jgi:hypothetical protein
VIFPRQLDRAAGTVDRLWSNRCLRATNQPRRNILCTQIQPLAHARGSACAFDGAGPRGHPVRERLAPSRHLVSLLFRSH